MGEPLHVLVEALGIEALEGLDNAGMERAPPILEQATEVARGSMRA